MFPRLLRPPKSSFFLFGPRGSGKTTWLREHFPRAHRIDLLDEARYQRYLADVSLFERELRALPAGSWVVVDEVQRLPFLLNEVHRAIEERKMRFALTGSSARKFRRAGVNLLAGRAVRRAMYPFAPEELGEAFDLHRALRIGTLPLIWTSEDPEDRLAAYARLYLKEEIQAEAAVRNLQGFARFLPIAALLHGQVVNVSNVARDAGVARTTVHGYVEVLQDTLIVALLPSFEAKLRVRERKHPKLYFIDPGLVRALKGAKGDPIAEERGALLEGFVHAMLCLYRDVRGLWDAVHYWAPAEARNTEVDFLVSAGRERFALEVKASARVRGEHFRGLRAIEGLAGLKARLLVHLGVETGRTSDGIDVLPFAVFCDRLRRRSLAR
ncbi:MAG: ATP-binding protein [Planctomycetes bacterium]|nr:ATP-binding protein [Planctomycetota bacterium]